MTSKDGPVFPFHYGQEGELYSYYRVPKLLFKEECFAGLSTDAKLLYGLFLDRLELSKQNKWLDEYGRVYVYFTVESIQKAMQCGNKKACALLAELDDNRGIGLITRVHQGQGKPDKIFVHKCITQGMSNEHFKECQKDMPRDVEMTFADMSKVHGNNTELNNTDMNNTESIYLSDERRRENHMLEFEAYRKLFEEQLDMDVLRHDYPYEHDALEEILDILVDTVCSEKKKIRICGEDKPAQLVKSQLLKLDMGHIQYVLGCIRENTTKVRNIKQYLLATLYNAPMTINNYYTTRVNHDLYGGDD